MMIPMMILMMHFYHLPHDCLNDPQQYRDALNSFISTTFETEFKHFVDDPLSSWCSMIPSNVMNKI